jgi:hypothetical protein
MIVFLLLLLDKKKKLLNIFNLQSLFIVIFVVVGNFYKNMHPVLTSLRLSSFDKKKVFQFFLKHQKHREERRYLYYNNNNNNNINKLSIKNNYKTTKCHQSSSSSSSSSSSTTSINDQQNQIENSSIPQLPSATKVVICGGGLVGTSIAYHLGELGYKDVILLTKDK